MIEKGNCNPLKSVIHFTVSASNLRYLIINNPMSPDALYQGQSDKNTEKLSNLASNQFICSLLKVDYFDHLT